MPAWERCVSGRRQHRVHHLECNPWSDSVHRRFDDQITEYKSKKQREGANESEPSCLFYYNQHEAQDYPENPCLAQKCEQFHYRSKPIGIQRVLDADQQITVKLCKRIHLPSLFAHAFRIVDIYLRYSEIEAACDLVVDSSVDCCQVVCADLLIALLAEDDYRPACRG